MPPLSHSVCLLHGFCPLCFQDKVGVTNRERVDHKHPRVDQLQLLHCRKPNSLMPLDMERPGELCEEPRTCRVACLVCGLPVFRGGTDEYTVFRTHFEEGGPQEGEGRGAAMEGVIRRNEMRQILREGEAVMTDYWHTPVHKRCAFKAPKCGCWMPLEAKECLTHRKMTPFTRAAKPAPAPPPAPVVKPVAKPAPPAPPAQPVVVRAPVPIAPPSQPEQPQEDEQPPDARQRPAGKGAVFVTDLPVSRDTEEPPPSRPLPPSRPMAQPQKRKTPAAPPEPAARLDGWVRREAPRPSTGLRPFDLREHERSFDPLVHGYVRKQNEMYYRYPDGRFLRVFSGVNKLTSDGQLLPDAGL